MPHIISLDYVPGVCDSIIPYFQKNEFIVLPTHTDIIKHSNVTANIASCIHNILSRLQHIKRCYQSDAAVVCTHWYNIPFRVLGTPIEDIMVRFMHRHTRDLIRAFHVSYTHIPIVLKVHQDECLERLITNMDGEEIGIHHIILYTQHLEKIPHTYTIDLPLNGIDIRYICERVVQVVQNILHGL
jgi:hypothetical protein